MNNFNSSRLSGGKKCSAMGIFANLFLFAAKLAVGIFSHSLSAVADAFNNLTDASGAIVSFIGFRFSEKRADAEHPYGHARAEYLSALIVAIFIILIGFELLKSAAEAVFNPVRVNLNWWIFAVLILSVIIKIIMAIYFYREGKSISSPTLIATAADSRNDSLVTSGIILGYLITHFTNFVLDGYISLFIAIFILASGFSLIKTTMDPLLGGAPDKELVDYIKSKILSYENVLGAHDLIVHDYGVGKIFASVHVEMAANINVMTSHDIIDRIEDDFLSNDNIHMIIHFDPIDTDDDSLSLRHTISEIASKIHPDCTIHDLKLKDSTISFDCVKPDDCTVSDEAIIAAFDVAIRLSNPDYKTSITIDKSFSPVIH